MEIQEIKSKLTLAQVLQHYGLKPDKNLRLHCPFHEDKTPSLQVYYKTHTAYCFSSNCKTHGKSMDVIDFVMHKESCTKAEAIQKAITLSGNEITLSSATNGTTTTPAVTKPTISKEQFLQNMFTYFKNAVHNSKPAQEYIKQRGLDSSKTEIGYNTGQFHHGTRKDEGLINDCLQTGLLSNHDRLSRTGEICYKPFAKFCIVFALRNQSNQVTGLYFRSTTNDQEQKHFYLKDSTGLYPAYPNPDKNKIIITESVIDAASLLQVESIAKEYNLLAAYGTNRLNDEMKSAIAEWSKVPPSEGFREAVFAFDNDEAGNKAAVKYKEELQTLLPQVTFTKLVLPCKDVNETLQAHNDTNIFTHLLNERTTDFSFSIEKEKPELTIGPEAKLFIEKPAIAETIDNTELHQAVQNPPSGQAGLSETQTKVANEVQRGCLSTSNPEAITYQTEELGFTILGGIRIDGLDRLRVTMKIEVINRKYEYYLNNPDIANLAIRHNLDLYNDVQVEKLIRKTAERLEVGSTELTKAIAEITSQLELYRLQQLEAKQKDKDVKKKILTPQEREAAQQFLQQENLMQVTNDCIGKSGVIGEHYNRLLMYIIFTSRKRENPLHIISFGSSGAGKSHLQEKLAELIPEEDKIASTSLTSNALYYFGEFDLQHRVILIEDMDGAEAVLYALRELISKQQIIKLVPVKDSKGITRTIMFKVTGPVTVAGCTTQEKVYEDNANRSFLIYIDESAEQDEAIMNYQRKKSAGTINTEEERQIKELLKNSQRLLQPIKVINPYAECLKIPTEVFKPRRTNAHYLQFIEAITFYHQYQREKHTDQATGETYITTTLQDIEEANKLMKEILLRKADELSGATRNYFELLKTVLKQNKQTTFTNKEVKQLLRLPISSIKRHSLELQQSNYIRRNESKQTKAYHFEIVSYEEYSQLQNSIATVLDNIYNSLKAQQPKTAQIKNEPVKPVPAKGLAATAQ